MADVKTNQDTSDMSQSNSSEKWIRVYPAYINSGKTLQEGRRIPKDKAVINPTVQEMRDVLTAAGLQVVIENKMYSRERSKDPVYQGRIKVQLWNNDGAVSSNFPSRDSVMLHLAAKIPQLKSRANKQKVAEHQLPPPPPLSTSGNVGARKKRKNKK